MTAQPDRPLRLGHDWEGKAMPPKDLREAGQILRGRLECGEAPAGGPEAHAPQTAVMKESRTVVIETTVGRLSSTTSLSSFC